MKQMQVPESMQVNIDFDQQQVPEVIRELRPVVYKDGDVFCVLLGEDPQAGIFGCGETQALALADWMDHYHQRMNNHPPGDAVVQYVEDTRNVRKEDL